MARIKKNYDDYSVLLGGNSLEAAGGSLFRGRTLRQVNTHQRTILIGIGGAGNNTINYVKGMLVDQMQPTWDKYIAFLAVDSDFDMLGNLKYITDAGERVCTTRDAADERMIDPDKNSNAVRRLMNPPLNIPTCRWDGKGSGQRRLMGRAKLHDCQPGQIGVDEEFVNKLERLVGRLENPSANTEYAVYVIGSICGGTCSGAIQDMPALIRHALSNTSVVGARLKIYAMLYVPDAMVGDLPFDAAARAKANGYAALKELNYYQGVSNRPGYPLLFPFNNRAIPDLSITKFFDEPMLIGSTLGAVPGANELAEQTVAEYLLNLFTKAQPQSAEGLMSGTTLGSALHNVAEGQYRFLPGSNEKREAVGEAHEFPYQFGTAGFAKAAAPQKIMVAYAVGRICELAGIKTADDKAPGGELPFRSSTFTAEQGTMHAKNLIKAFDNLLPTIYNGTFDFVKSLNAGEAVDWRKIHNGEYGNNIDRAGRYIQNCIDVPRMEGLQDSIKQMYASFVTDVTTFIKEYGPLAFSRVYYGDFTKGSGYSGKGIKEMLHNLMRGKTADGANYTGYLTPETCQKAFNETMRSIQNEKNSLGNQLGIIGGPKQRQASTWLRNYNAWAASRINKARHDMAIGANQYVDELICQRAAVLADEVDQFAHLLSSLSDIYSGFENQVKTFREFSNARDSKCEINLAAQDEKIYQWLKGQVDDYLATVNLRDLRDGLVDDFMAEPNEWLDDADAVRNEGTALISSSKPISARARFDEFIGGRIGNFQLQISIQDIFNQLQAQGASIDMVAQDIMDRLKAQSAVQFNGDVTGGTKATILLIPSALSSSGGNGQAIADALKKCAGDAQVFDSDDVDAIVMYTSITELPVYRLQNLESWEKEYLVAVTNPNNGVHGLSPSAEARKDEHNMTTYHDRIKWSDYPALTVSRTDPRLPDGNHEISCEGRMRKEVDQVLAEAEKYGIVSYKQEPTGEWKCTYTYLDNAWNWTFDPSLCSCDADGFLPVGEALMEEILGQNGVSNSASKKKEIALAGVGVLMRGSYESEALAREYIPRILRSHVPMYLEIKETLQKFQGENGWGNRVTNYNQARKKKGKPRKIVRMIFSGLLRINGRGIWEIEKPDKKVRPFFNTMTTSFLSGCDKAQAQELSFYYLYKQLVKTLGSDEEFDACVQSAEDVLSQLAAQDEREVLEANRKLAKQAEHEIALLSQNGADLQDLDAPMPIRFRNFITPFVSNDQEAQDILDFYAGVEAELK